MRHANPTRGDVLAFHVQRYRLCFIEGARRVGRSTMTTVNETPKDVARRLASGEPEFPQGKPLYRLHDLVSRPGETVIVCEGEWPILEPSSKQSS